MTQTQPAAASTTRSRRSVRALRTSCSDAARRLATGFCVQALCAALQACAGIINRCDRAKACCKACVRAARGMRSLRWPADRSAWRWRTLRALGYSHPIGSLPTFAPLGDHASRASASFERFPMHVGVLHISNLYLCSLCRMRGNTKVLLFFLCASCTDCTTCRKVRSSIIETKRTNYGRWKKIW